MQGPPFSKCSWCTCSRPVPAPTLGLTACPTPSTPCAHLATLSTLGTQVEMTCLVPDAGNDMVMVLVLGKRGSLPVLQAQLRMPISEPEEA